MAPACQGQGASRGTLRKTGCMESEYIYLLFGVPLASPFFCLLMFISVLFHLTLTITSYIFCFTFGPSLHVSFPAYHLFFWHIYTQDRESTASWIFINPNFQFSQQKELNSNLTVCTGHNDKSFKLIQVINVLHRF